MARQTKAMLLERIAELEAAERARQRLVNYISFGRGKLVKKGPIDDAEANVVRFESATLGNWIQEHEIGDELEIYIRG